MRPAKARPNQRKGSLPLFRPARETRRLQDAAMSSRFLAADRKDTRLKSRWRGSAAQLSPARHISRDAVPAGILYMKGSFLLDRQSEILQRLRNVERAASAKNPFDRVLGIVTRSPREVRIDTTSDKLAHRLGRALHRAFHGNLRFRFSHQDRLLRVYWHRDLAEVST